MWWKRNLRGVAILKREPSFLSFLSCWVCVLHLLQLACLTCRHNLLVCTQVVWFHWMEIYCLWAGGTRTTLVRRWKALLGYVLCPSLALRKKIWHCQISDLEPFCLGHICFASCCSTQHTDICFWFFRICGLYSREFHCILNCTICAAASEREHW